MTGFLPPEDERRASLKTAAAFEKFYKLLACAALLFITAPICQTIIFPLAGAYSIPLTIVAVPAAFSAGYALQALFGAVTGIKRVPFSRAYEKVDKHFSIKEAALPLIICGITGIAIKSLFFDLMQKGYFLKIGILYDKSSAIPFTAGLISASIMAMGVVIWFYPHGYIISLRSSFVFIISVIVDFIFNLMYSQQQTFLAVCFALFLLTALAVVNQNQIISVINAAGTGIVTPRVRIYNLISVSIIYLLIAAAIPLILTVFIGLAVLTKMILFFIIRNILAETADTEMFDAETGAATFSESVFRGLGVGENFAKVFYFIFMLILLVTVISFIIIRRRNIFKFIFDLINNLFANLMDFLSNVLKFNQFTTEKFVLADYRDIEAKTDKNAIRDYKDDSHRPPRSYRDFSRRLDAISDPRARLVFAYIELVRCWGEKNIRLRISDTPAEIEKKISAASVDANAKPITKAFEHIKYAELDISEEESRYIVGAMCNQIKQAYKI